MRLIDMFGGFDCEPAHLCSDDFSGSVGGDYYGGGGNPDTGNGSGPGIGGTSTSGSSGDNGTGSAGGPGLDAIANGGMTIGIGVAAVIEGAPVSGSITIAAGVITMMGGPTAAAQTLGNTVTGTINLTNGGPPGIFATDSQTMSTLDFSAGDGNPWAVGTVQVAASDGGQFDINYNAGGWLTGQPVPLTLWANDNSGNGGNT